jgi:hypothetical protein
MSDPSTPSDDDDEINTQRGGGELGLSDDFDGEEPSPEEVEQIREELANLESELLQAPVADVVANHCYGLFQLAALHLGQRPPHLEEGRVAIDALGGVIDALGARLGHHLETFTDALAQLRLAYVQLHGAASAPAAGAEGASPTP